MNQREFQRLLRSVGLKIDLKLTPAELYAVTLQRFELNSLGLGRGKLLPVLFNISDIEDGELSPSDVLHMKSVNSRTDFKIRTIDMTHLLRSIGKKGVGFEIDNHVPEFVGRKTMREKGVNEDDLLAMTMSHLVLAKLRLSEEDLRKIGVDEKIIAMKDNKNITVIFQKYTKQLDSRRAKECPFIKRCYKLFENMSDRGFNSFSCATCPIFKVETHLELQGHFHPIEIGSYGVAPVGYIG